jgi:hypothetical protein
MPRHGFPANSAVGQLRQPDVGIPVTFQAGHGLVRHFLTGGFCASLCRYSELVGFGRACAPLHYGHPSFWVHCHAQRGAARPPAQCSFTAPPKIKNRLFPERPKLGPPGAYNFSTGLSCTLSELRCTKSYAAPSELSCTLLSYAAS